jgi:AraC family transcriptional regulator
METFAERFDTATATRTRFEPGAISLQDKGRWPGIRLEQWNSQAGELPETVLFQHGLLINLALKSSEIRWIGHRPIAGDFPTGSLAILPAGLPYKASSTRAAATMVLGMAPEFLQSVARTPSMKAVELRPGYGLSDSFVQEACIALARDIREGYPSGSMYGESIAVALAAHLVRNHSADPRLHSGMLSASDLKRERIREFVLERLEEPLSLAQMASFVQLDVYSFARWFKRAFGMAPHQYVLVERVERAKALLRSTTQSVVSVALQCGFSSQSHLTTSFRRHVGVAPKAFRSVRQLGGQAEATE